MALSPQEALRDLTSLHEAIASQRKSVVRIVTDRHYRKRRGKNVIRRIRDLTSALEQAHEELAEIRGASDGTMSARVDQYDSRLRDLRKLIIHAQQRVRIEKLLKLKAQMEAMDLELPEELKVLQAD